MDITASSNPNIYDYANTFFMDPNFFIILVVIIFLYILLFTSLGDFSSNTSSNLDDSSNTTTTVMIIVIVVFGILALVNAVQYFFGISVSASIQNLFSNSPEIDIDVNQTTSSAASSPSSSNAGLFGGETQVFNIPGNYYGYNDAKTLCAAYNSRLATYDEVEQAYNNGGEWCNYGWSEGQMALFPTQKSTYKNLQKISGHEHDCGRPGVNGGYMANPKIKFGVNCYGPKPRMTSEEQQYMMTNTPYPKTEKDLAMEKQIEYWKNHLTEILVSPFNYTNWNMI